jgi:YD repeat-containing protein
LTPFTFERLQKLSFPSGAVGTFSYDGAGKLSKIEAPGSRTWTVTVNGSGDLTVIQDPDGSLRSFSYLATSHRLSSEQLGARQTSLAYDSGRAHRHALRRLRACHPASG